MPVVYFFILAIYFGDGSQQIVIVCCPVNETVIREYDGNGRVALSVLFVFGEDFMDLYFTKPSRKTKREKTVNRFIFCVLTKFCLFVILRVLFLASCETLVINTVFFLGGGGAGIRGGGLDLDLYTAWTILGHFCNGTWRAQC